MDILEMVNAIYESLSPVQKRIADFMFKYPDEVCFYSLKDLAESMGVTEVTILRFTKKIGVGSFVELKKRLKEHLQNRLMGGDSLNRVADQMGSSQDTESDKAAQFEKFVQNENRVLQSTYSRIRLEQVQEAVSIIHEAQTVYVIGSEITSGLSSYLTRRFLNIGIKAMDLGAVSRALFNNYASQMGPEDAVVMFSVPGYAKHLVNAARYLEKKQVPLILITDRESAPAASCAVTTLCCDNRDLFFYNSLLGMFSVSSLLAYFTAAVDPEETNRRRGRLSEAREAIDLVMPMNG